MIPNSRDLYHVGIGGNNGNIMTYYELFYECEGVFDISSHELFSDYGLCYHKLNYKVHLLGLLTVKYLKTVCITRGHFKVYDTINGLDQPCRKSSSGEQLRLQLAGHEPCGYTNLPRLQVARRQKMG